MAQVLKPKRVIKNLLREKYKYFVSVYFFQIRRLGNTSESLQNKSEKDGNKVIELIPWDCDLDRKGFVAIYDTLYLAEILLHRQF